MLSNFHTHSNYCDGKASLREMAEYAYTNGFSILGFSGHSPLPFNNTFSITDYEGYCNEVRRLKEEYEGKMEIYLGLEFDYVPRMLEDFTPLIEKGGLEYTIGSVHLIPEPGAWTEQVRSNPYPPAGDSPLKGGESADDHLWFIDGPKWERYDEGLNRFFGGDIRRGVTAYFHQQNDMIVSNRPTIVGHPDKIAMHNRGRYFKEDEPWYEQLALETLSLIHEQGLICEVNTRGIYKGRHPDYYPSRRLIRQMKQWRIPLIVSTDAHAPSDLLRTENAYQFLRDVEYPCVLNTIF